MNVRMPNVGRGVRRGALGLGTVALATTVMIGVAQAHDPCPGAGCDHTGGNPFTLDVGSVIRPANTGATLGTALLLNSAGCCNAGNRMIWAHSPGFADWGIRYDDNPDKMHWQQAEAFRFFTVDFGFGRVGVGQESPLTDLHVGGGNVAPVTAGLTALFETANPATSFVVKSTTGGEMFFYQDGVNGLFGTASTHPVGIRTNNTNRVWITSGGLVGIGTTAPTSALHVIGTFTATGTKNFAMADPDDASKMIYYAAMEGPEAGTYVRGTATLAGAEAVVELPAHFRKVTEAEGVTVQLTPTGGWHRLYVAEKSNQRMVVRDADGCVNVQFDYFVQGIRRGYKDYQVERDVAQTR